LSGAVGALFTISRVYVCVKFVLLAGPGRAGLRNGKWHPNSWKKYQNTFKMSPFSKFYQLLSKKCLITKYKVSAARLKVPVLIVLP
jgi:hypothetical protein